MTIDRSDAPPDRRERFFGRMLRVINPIAERLIVHGLPTGAPNVLLTVRGRRTGIDRTVPIAILELDGRRFVQSSYGRSGWAPNLRAAGEAVVTDGARHEAVRAAELPPEEAGVILQRVLAPCHHSHLLRALLGPGTRPPASLLRRYRVRIDDSLDDYLVEARRHPVFELWPVAVPSA